MQKTIDASKTEMKESIVNIRRVAKTVKGGRNMRFSVTVVVGDEEGNVGVGLGKAREIPEAVRKAIEDGKKKMIHVPMVGTTIPHRSLGVFGAGRVLLMPGAEGTGVIAGSSVRTVLELAGIKDIRAKSIGSNNAGNMAYATIEGLKGLKTIEEVSRLRGKTKEEILGKPGEFRKKARKAAAVVEAAEEAEAEVEEILAAGEAPEEAVIAPEETVVASESEAAPAETEEAAEVEAQEAPAEEEQAEEAPEEAITAIESEEAPAQEEPEADEAQEEEQEDPDAQDQDIEENGDDSDQ